VLADAGYWHSDQIERLTGRGTVVSILPDAGKRKGARPGWDGGLYAFVRRVLATDHGGALYRRRNVMIEPVFANTKFNRRIDRFQRRGRAAARSDWRLITATHKLVKHAHAHARGRRPLRAPGRCRLAARNDQRRCCSAGPDRTSTYATALMGTSSRRVARRLLLPGEPAVIGPAARIASRA
jgi:Transposase DDE domain